MNSLGNAYAAAGRRAEAIELQEKTLALTQKMNGPETRMTLAAMNNLADSYASSGQWPHAVVLISNLVELKPDGYWWHHSFALLLVQTGNSEGYRRHCAQALARFGSTSDPAAA